MTDDHTWSDEELITKLRAGDDVAEALLYMRYKQVVRSKARGYFLVGADQEDIIQEGMVGLYKAVCDYAFDKQVSFRAYADLCITRQIFTAIKGATRKKHMPLNNYISFSYPISDGETTLGDVLKDVRVSDPEELFIDRENYETTVSGIEKALSRLEQNALILFLNGYSYRRIADILGKPVKSVDNAIQRVKKKLVEQLDFPLSR